MKRSFENGHWRIDSSRRTEPEDGSARPESPDPTAEFVLNSSERPPSGDLLGQNPDSEGEVVATVRSRDGTALAGTHYSAIEQTVIFEDGENVPRAVTLPLITNNTNDGNVERVLGGVATPTSNDGYGLIRVNP